MLQGIKEFSIGFVDYIFPALAIVISIVSLIQSSKSNKLQARINQIEEKLKIYELEEIEREKENATKACVEARIIRISNNNYVLKIWNSGKGTAFNIDFTTPKEYKIKILRRKVPFEFLESGKSFEEHAIVDMGTSDKFVIITRWENEEGTEFIKEQMCSL
jgi:hypothetical protein